ncbi:unnamed protein product [Orchesella dallaii]|uniref:Rab11 family-interacting protein 1 n=1 Tax=Orchesella dallaii TaxID=48710 RepID=A0ABP1QNU4_9HEXA
MLTPTHIQVAVFHTKDLLIKGKNGTNDPFIVFALGKQKFQSSVKEKISDSLVEWNEGCDIAIPSSQGNKTELVLKVMHKASLGENFIGRISIPLSDFEVTAKQKPKWYPLKPRPGKEKDTKYRGEIEMKVTFLIKTNTTESTNDLASNSKRRGSLRSSMGSILSLGKKKGKKEKEKGSKDSLNSSSIDSLKNVNSSRLNLSNNMPIINDDPGVISEGEEDDDGIVMKSHIQLNEEKLSISSGSGSVISGSFSDRVNSGSLPSTPKTRGGFRGIFSSNNSINNDDDFNGNTLVIPKPRTVRLPSVIVEEPPAITVTAPPPKLPVSASMSNLMDAGKGTGKGGVRKQFKAMFNSSKHMSIDEINYNPQSSPSMTRAPSIRDLKIPKETYKQYERKSKEELIAMILSLQGTTHSQKQKISDLEDYIDKLLLRVLDNMPVLLKKSNSIRQS